MLKEARLPGRNFGHIFGFQKYLTPAVLLGLILLLGAALRAYDLATKSYWIDEMSTVIEGQQSLQQLFASGRLDQPPAYYLPFHLWVRLFGTTEVSTRSFSAVFGIGSILIIYMIGRELFGKRAGLLSAFLMAVAEFQIYNSQIARFYSFFEFMTLLSFFFFILALRSKKKNYYLLYVLASVIMVYADTFGIFNLVAQNLFFLIQAVNRRNAIAAWLICQALIALALFPYLFPLLFGAGGIRGAVELNIGEPSTPSILDPLRSVYHFVFSPRRERSWEIILFNYAAAGAFLVAGTWIYAIRQEKSNFLTTARGWVANLQEVPDATSKLLLVSCWLLCPMLFPLILSPVFGSMYSDRYAISAAPALYLLIALCLYNAHKVVPVMISLVALVVMIAPGLSQYYLNDVNEEWRKTAAYVSENSETGDAIAIAPNMGIGTQQRTFNWYYRGALQECGLDSKLLAPDAISEALRPCISGHDRLWVVIANYSDLTSDDRFRSFFLNTDQSAMHLVREQGYFGISVYLFELVRK